MFHNILVCVDGSVHSDRALDEAMDLATAENGRLTILTAIPRLPAWAGTSATAAAVQPLANELRAQATTALRDAVDRVPQSMPVTTILSDKPIREALTEQLRAGTYDLLVMGSRGRGALTSSVLGSVSHYALNHAGVPVLIIHAAVAQNSEQSVDDRPRSAATPSAEPNEADPRAPAETATLIA
jgi:nucleotide-binding universal stress UspA family protein